MNTLKFEVKKIGEVRINWNKNQLPIEIIELICKNIRQVSLKRISATSIIRYYFLLNRLVERGGNRNGIPCDECGTLCLAPYRIAESTSTGENTPTLSNTWYDRYFIDKFSFFPYR